MSTSVKITLFCLFFFQTFNLKTKYDHLNLAIFQIQFSCLKLCLMTVCRFKLSFTIVLCDFIEPDSFLTRFNATKVQRPQIQNWISRTWPRFFTWWSDMLNSFIDTQKNSKRVEILLTRISEKLLSVCHNCWNFLAFVKDFLGRWIASFDLSETVYLILRRSFNLTDDMKSGF